MLLAPGLVAAGTTGALRAPIQRVNLRNNERLSNNIKKYCVSSKSSVSLAVVQATTQASPEVAPAGNASKQHMQTEPLVPLYGLPLCGLAARVAALAVVSSMAS